MNKDCLTNFDNAVQTAFVFKLAKNPSLTYNTQSVTFPSISVNDIPINHKNYKGYVPDNVIQYEALNISFIVDEVFNNYNYLYRQMLLSETAQDKNIDECFDELHVFRLNNHKQAIADIVFYDAFCTNLSSIDYTVNASDEDPIVCNATFRYQKFEIITL